VAATQPTHSRLRRPWDRETVGLKTASLSTLWLLAALAVLSSPAVRAEHSADPCAALFDHPLAVQTVPASSSAGPGEDVTCTYYRDFMVRDTGTNSPDPNDPRPATIISVSDASRRPACNAARAAHAAREVSPKTVHTGLLGRKGPYLFFANFNGAAEFYILSAATGRVLYSDGIYGGGTDCPLQSVAVKDGTLHIRFTRAFFGSCSIPKDGASCWARMAQEGKIPRSLAQSPPPVPACAAAYRKQQLPPDDSDPSIIYYDMDMALDPSGRTQVNSRGTIGCEPEP
jgi:hypothetical protein